MTQPGASEGRRSRPGAHQGGDGVGPDDDTQAIRDGLKAQAGEVAIRLLGKPPSSKTSADWRWGGKGGLSLVVRGAKAGLWTDFRTEEGGDLVALIHRERGGEIRDAFAWARDFLGMSAWEERTTLARTPFDLSRFIAKGGGGILFSLAGAAEWETWDAAQAAREGAAADQAAAREVEAARLAARRQANAGIEAASAANEQARKRDDAEDIWQTAQPLAGTQAEAYLKARGVTLPEGDVSRYHPRVTDLATKKKYPAMVTAVREADGTFRALHVTFLHPDTALPQKAPISPAKKLRASPETGGAWLTQRRGPAIIVGEGIETTLAAQAGRPDAGLVSGLTAGGVGKLELPPEARVVWIVVDHDDAGQRASCDAATRWASEGREVRLVRPAGGVERIKGFDCADLLAEGGADAVRAAFAAAEPFMSDTTARLREDVKAQLAEIARDDVRAPRGNPHYPAETRDTLDQARAQVAAAVDPFILAGVVWAAWKGLRDAARAQGVRVAMVERPDLADARHARNGDPRRKELRKLAARQTRALYRGWTTDLRVAGMDRPKAPPLPLVIRATAGVGKTEGTLRAIKAALARLPAGVPVRVDALVQNHQLAGQIAADARKRGLPVTVLRGRDEKHKDAGGKALCVRANLANQVARAGLSVRGGLCGVPGGDACPARLTCGYYRQADDVPDRGIVVATHHALASGEVPADLKLSGLVVVDESAMNAALGEPVRGGVDLLADRRLWPALVMGTREDRATDAAAFGVCEAVGGMFQAMGGAALSADGWQAFLGSHGVTLDGLRDAAARQRGLLQAERREAREVRPSMTDASIKAALDGRQAGDRARLAALLDALVEDWEAARGTLQSVSVRHNEEAEGGRRLMFMVHMRRPFLTGGRAVLVLDASAGRQVSATLWGDDVRMADIGASRQAHVVQVVAPSFSKSALGVGKYRSSDQAEVAKAEHRRKTARDALRGLVARHGENRVAGVTHKDFCPYLADVPGVLPLAHFGSLRGLNGMRDADAILIVGQSEPTAEAMENQARALARGTGRKLGLIPAIGGVAHYLKEDRDLRMRDRSKRSVTVKTHSDPLVRECLEAVRERELEQAVDRVRAVQRPRDGSRPATIYLLAGAALDVTVDEVVSLDALALSLATDTPLRDGKAVPICLEWLGVNAPSCMARSDGLPLSEDRARGRVGALGQEIVSSSMRFRGPGGRPAFPQRVSIAGMPAPPSLHGYVLKSHPTPILALVPDGQDARRGIELATGKPVLAVVECGSILKEIWPMLMQQDQAARQAALEATLQAVDALRANAAALEAWADGRAALFPTVDPASAEGRAAWRRIGSPEWWDRFAAWTASLPSDMQLALWGWDRLGEFLAAVSYIEWHGPRDEKAKSLALLAADPGAFCRAASPGFAADAGVSQDGTVSDLMTAAGTMSLARQFQAGGPAALALFTLCPRAVIASLEVAVAASRQFDAAHGVAVGHA